MRDARVITTQHPKIGARRYYSNGASPSMQSTNSFMGALAQQMHGQACERTAHQHLDDAPLEAKQGNRGSNRDQR